MTSKASPGMPRHWDFPTSVARGSITRAPSTRSSAATAAAVFNQAGAALAKHGLKFYYHNHGYEFEPYDQGTLFDLLAAETDPQTVFFQMDVMWTVFRGKIPPSCWRSIRTAGC